jgi:hypothetical protein
MRIVSAASGPYDDDPRPSSHIAGRPSNTPDLTFAVFAVGESAAQNEIACSS